MFDGGRLDASVSLLAGEVQRVALSATVHPLDAVARFVGGYELAGTAQNDRALSWAIHDVVESLLLLLRAPRVPQFGGGGAAPQPGFLGGGGAPPGDPPA